MTNGTSALSLDEKTAGGLVPHPDPAARRGEWSFEQHLRIVEALKAYGCEYLNGREEYTLLKEIVTPDSVSLVLCRAVSVQPCRADDIVQRGGLFHVRKHQRIFRGEE